jgi:hypothetical protein
MRLAWSLLGLGAVLGVLVTAGTAFLAQIHCTDGDGGSPYVARDSAQADVCAATGNGLGVLIAAAVLLVLVGLLAWRLLSAWAYRRGSLRAALAAVVAMPLLPLLLGWVQNLPSDRCPKDEQAVFDAWRADGGRGARPHDCETY